MTTAVVPRLLDELLPAYVVGAVYSRTIAAGSDEAFAALRTFTAADLRVTGTLMTPRGLMGGRRESAWRLIGLGSGVIRRDMLATSARRAEAGA